MGTRNEGGETLLEFAEASGFVIANTHFDKPLRKRTTYSSGDNESQVDYILVNANDRKSIKKCFYGA